MIIEQLVPAKSPTMTEGTIVSWRVKPGDKVKSGDVIAEIQSDKAVVEWEVLDGGTVAEILIPAGTMAQVNQVAAIFTTKGEDVKEAVAKAKATNAKLAPGGAAPAPAPVAATPVPTPVAAPTAAPVASTPAALAKGVRVSPVAAKIASSLGVDLRAVKGTGPDGRIVRRDVEAAAKAGTAKLGAAGAAAKPEKPKLKVLRADKTDSDVAMTPMRLIIGKRLLEAKTTIPHFYVSESVDAGALVALREQVNLLDGFKVTVNDLIVRASALALRAHPKLNATFQGNSIRYYDSADISVAVAIPDGLITPIVAKAHTKNLKQIGDEVRVLAKKAVDGKLQPAEFQGGSFTISNLGMFGISEFVAIINPPQVAILAVAGIKDEPVVKNGTVVPGKVMRLTLSADHRAVDGADAAAFMKTLRELLEAPATLLV
ncbi:MAG: pyruvate dehydrogenase complex dihydrolipoamide acetyltransferase [Planctomycetes bacterium]|nr:pyruvate dehydrogenase complex dihydrolipoamide acetyltransferase [Planctomycetota bacterium]